MDSVSRNCSTCKQPFPLTNEYFYKDKRQPHGLCYECKPCYKARKRAYHHAHKDVANARSKAWRAANQDKFNAYHRAMYHRDPEKARARVATYRLTHKPKVDRAVSRAKWHSYKASKLNASGTHTKADIALLYKSQKGLCWWCSKPVGEDYHVDHRIPLSRGGSNAPENLCISCPTCNLRKHNKLPQEWNGRLL